jgi:hypothetical protein
MSDTIGIVGTAKNTGKTTTLSVLLKECAKHDESIGLTGIGYDGEAVDNLTFLPKPRLDVPAGTWVVTSSMCLEAATAKFNQITPTGLNTSLGEIQIARVIEQGRVILAGPNNREALNMILKMLKEKSCTKILVDGSLSRIIPLTAAKGIVFATGAARNTNPKILAEEMAAISEIFNWQDNPPINSFPQNITLIYKDNKSNELNINSILTNDDIKTISSLMKDLEQIIIPGVIAEPMWKPVLSMINKISLLFFHPGVIMLHSNIPVLVKDLNKFRNNGGKISFQHQLTIKAITLNPFYPKKHSGIYQEAFIDRMELNKSFEFNFKLPIFDVKHDPPEDLFKVCFL